MLKNLSFNTIALGGLLMAPLLFGGAKSPDLSGTWQMDAAKSHVADGRTLTLSIAQTPEHIKLDATVAAKAGEKTPLHLDCKIDGSDCAFDEGAHKSKANIWIADGKVVICKSDGPAGDAATEWHAALDPASNALTIEVEHVDPVATAETMVFTKKPAE
jgi:hypothetical protein